MTFRQYFYHGIAINSDCIERVCMCVSFKQMWDFRKKTWTHELGISRSHFVSYAYRINTRTREKIITIIIIINNMRRVWAHVSLRVVNDVEHNMEYVAFVDLSVLKWFVCRWCQCCILILNSNHIFSFSSFRQLMCFVVCLHSNKCFTICLYVLGIRSEVGIRWRNDKEKKTFFICTASIEFLHRSPSSRTYAAFEAADSECSKF